MKTLITILAVLLTTCNFIAISQTISVEDIWKKYAFYAENIHGFRSMKDGEYFTKISDIKGKKVITKHLFTDFEGDGEIIVNLKDLTIKGAQLKIDDYYFNASETKILFTTKTKSIYRRSFSATYYLYDIETKELSPLDEKRQPQTLAEYSPDGKKVSFIYDNNLFIKDLSSNKVTQITQDGKFNKVINGTTDWVYEEEFAITKAYEWSYDSKNIAFLKFNETNVREFTMTYFNDLYPELYQFKYPKAGEANSKVELFIYKTDTKITDKIDLESYEYIPRLKWSPNQPTLIIQTLNRHQNHLSYYNIHPEKGVFSASKFFEEKSDQYVEIDDNLLILSDGKTILRTSETDGFNHIYKLNVNGNQQQITSGNWDVISLKGIDSKNKTIYYTSAEPGAIYKAIYKINIDGKKKALISNATGYSDADFSNGMKYFIKTYSNANTPPVYTLHKNTGKTLATLKDNSSLKNTIKEFNFTPKEFITFKGVTDSLNGWIIKPANFDPNKKYPVYINIYGGPGSNMVSDSWGGMNLAYHQLLAQNGYIVVSVDPRGTMYRGAKFKKSTYLELGKLETEDFIAVAKELGTMKFVDSSRIGIMGWSYGGFMTSLAMTKGDGIFKMGIAVAPVTNWRYYDNIYTERFMRTPQENESGYDDNSPINFVNQLKGSYFLIHGSGDDNVHYQNAMEMVSALVEANKQFDLFIYPNKNHGIYGGNTRNHLFNMMLNYTLKNL